MSRSDMMRKKRRSNSVDLIRLIKKIDCFKSTLICVFEGEDSKYYGSRIDHYLNKLNRKNLSCKGKKNVLNLRDKISENKELNDANILFFIDSDFDEPLSDYNLYSTPCYAIENLYASTSVFSRVITDELGLCSFQDKELIEELIAKYQQFESASDEALIELNAWLIVRVKESETNENIKLNLNNTSIDNFLTIEDFNSAKAYCISELDSIFNVSEPINGDDLASALHTVEQSTKNKFCRGKYRLEYFRAFLTLMFNEARKGEGSFVERIIKPKLSLAKANVVSELAQYADTPDCLNNFLNKYKDRIAA
ncbi:DUF4435 domain-containing protein [Vibrio coralliilyticus OCN008]|uniref:DUF4435 domain-containing protein n=1 Tax=Vibrio coralliilyticus TaxID=190893 RepID=UPI0003917E2E|nr:DUF4435 domain-containing protein [Vibrio coralliilyticus]ERB63990.1 hypothetical protein N779_17895 [Vibrio coralliilyticus OCN008]QIJ87063.1 DUF4435 domain-containing protein [Vibrio coralliilyticus OCN008]